MSETPIYFDGEYVGRILKFTAQKWKGSAYSWRVKRSVDTYYTYVVEYRVYINHKKRGVFPVTNHFGKKVESDARQVLADAKAFVREIYEEEYS